MCQCAHAKAAATHLGNPQQGWGWAAHPVTEFQGALPDPHYIRCSGPLRLGLWYAPWAGLLIGWRHGLLLEGRLLRRRHGLLRARRLSCAHRCNDI